MWHKPRRKPVPPPLPEPHSLRAGQTVTIDGSPATITGVANLGGHYRVGVQIDGWTTQLYARPDGTLLPKPPAAQLDDGRGPPKPSPAPLKTDRLFLSGVLK